MSLDSKIADGLDSEFIPTSSKSTMIKYCLFKHLVPSKIDLCLKIFQTCHLVNKDGGLITQRREL